MTTEQTAQQLELAAQILRTGHPFEVRHDASDRWHASLGVNPAQAVLQNWCLRPVLATPPDNRPIHNPDNLTAEQVGVGYRLVCHDDKTCEDKLEKWIGDEWVVVRGPIGQLSFRHCASTYRLPISVPWPEPVDPYAELKAAQAAGKVIEVFVEDDEYGPDRWSKKESGGWPSPPESYRIKPTESAKPDALAFTLPPPPPGMRWHREGGWTADDLPQGYRPLVAGEPLMRDEPFRYGSGVKDRVNGIAGHDPANFGTCRFVTTRPLTFNHAGKTWTYHRPGDPMPCDGEARIEIVCREGRTEQENGIKYLPRLARNNVWEETLGWRFAEPQTKTVPLGPEDVRCGDEIQSLRHNERRSITCVFVDGISVAREGFVSYEDLKSRKIRRRDSNEFVPCSKTIPADENLAKPKSR